MNVVRAAGGVVTRRGDDGALEVAVVHRPRDGDWSLPKGKLEPGEDAPHAARREVREETGLVCSLVRELAATRYRDRHGRPKEVRWWSMRVEAEEPFRPSAEVDARVWLPVREAATLLTYAADRALVESLGPPDDLPPPARQSG